jgi:NTE family protein
VGDIAPTAFHRVEECIRRGEEAIRPHLEKLQEKLAEWQGEKKHE